MAAGHGHAARMNRPTLLLATALLLTAGPVPAQGPAAPQPARQTELVRMVRQDCGSCHGIHLTGGLGPPLTAAAMRAIPQDSLVAVIVHGRPGTAMPGWKTMLNDADASWIAQQLQAGFPLEGRAQP